MLVLEVGLVKGLEWRVDVEVAVERNGKVGVTEASSHVLEFFWGGGVCVKTVGIQRGIHQHDRTGDGGSRGDEKMGRNSIN